MLAFPALVRPAASVPASLEVLGDESTCFSHPLRRALLVCDGCGRFLCGLCDLPMGERHICPSCLEAESRKGSLPLEPERVLWDRIALSLAIVPLLVGVWPTIVCAPITLVLVVLKWHAPASLVSRSRPRFVAAFTVALLEIAGWVTLAAVLVAR